MYTARAMTAMARFRARVTLGGKALVSNVRTMMSVPHTRIIAVRHRFVSMAPALSRVFATVAGRAMVFLVLIRMSAAWVSTIATR
jgi:hypothetical protein